MNTAVGSTPHLRSFQLTLQAAGLRPHTIENYLRDVHRLMGFLGHADPGIVKPDDIRRFVGWMQSERSAKTVHEAQLALRRFFAFLVAEGDLRSDPSRSTKLVRYKVPPLHPYTPDEVRQMIAACPLGTLEGVRDRAIVTVLFDTGVRAGELVSIGLPDWGNRCVWVDGKTGPRLIPLGVTSIESLDRYVRRWHLVGGQLWGGRRGPLTGLWRPSSRKTPVRAI